MKTKSIAVYLGSAKGNDPKFMKFAYDFGARMAREGIRVVYGGACVGTMDALADGVLEAGGQIVGVFPRGFGGKKEVQRTGRRVDREGLSEMVFVKDFAERKETMEELSDCAVALPGGIGTMDELFCFALGAEICLHEKPAYALNLDGFYDGLKMMVEQMEATGFVPPRDRLITVVDTVDDLLAQL